MTSNTFDTWPFEILLLSPCLLPGQTSFKEKKASVKVEPEEGETILFFNIDDQSNPDCKLRNFLWGKKTDQTICDLIVFYAKERERVICFVELKDNIADLGHATEQVINTYNSLKSRLNPNSYEPKAFIYGFAGSAPHEHQEYQKKLSKVFENNFEWGKRNNDLGNILRGIPPTIGAGKINKRK